MKGTSPQSDDVHAIFIWLWCVVTSAAWREDAFLSKTKHFQSIFLLLGDTAMTAPRCSFLTSCANLRLEFPNSFTYFEFDSMTLRKEGRDILFPLLEGVESESVSDEYVNGGGREGELFLPGRCCNFCSVVHVRPLFLGFLFHLHF